MSATMETARITITRSLSEDGHDFTMVATSEGMSTIEALGMLRLAENSILRDDDEPDG